MAKYGYVSLEIFDMSVERFWSRLSELGPSEDVNMLVESMLELLRHCRSEIACAHSEESAKMGAVEYLKIRESEMIANYQREIDAINAHRQQLRDGLLRMVEQLK